MITPKVPKVPKIYICEDCDYSSNRKSHYQRHLTTDKHKIVTNSYAPVLKSTKPLMHSCMCGKSYKYRQSLYNHKKQCKKYQDSLENSKNSENTQLCKYIDDNNDYDNIDNIDENAIITQENSQKYTSMIMKVIKDNKEFKETLIAENKALREQISELIPQIGNTTNNIKQRFNIQVFLNEKCKDALSIDEFINKLEISMKNLLTTRDKGLDQGVSNIIIDNMNKLSIYERPIHCTDKKRETVYVKNDEWRKDENREEVNRLLKQTEFKQMQNIKQWTDEHPGYADDDQLSKEYINLVMKCTSSIESCKDKVIKKVCDNVYLTERE